MLTGSAALWAGTILSSCQFAGGNSNLTWQFRDGERACVVRTPPLMIFRQRLREESSGGTNPSGDSRLSGQGAGVLAWCDDEKVIGRPFLVQEWVDGVALTDALPVAYTDSSDSVNRLGEDLIDQLAAFTPCPPI